MKRIYILPLCLLLVLAACKEPVQAPEREKIDFTKSATAIMDNIRPKLYGSWSIKEINLVPAPPSTSEIGIYKDTTILDLGQLDIYQVNSSGYNASSNDVTGVIRFDRKVYPVGFRMLATGERVYQNKGPQVFGVFDYRFPVGSQLTEPQENYLRHLNLIGSNFEMETSEDGRTMIWKALGRAVKSMRLVKN
jgi:hypothetical protein